MTTLDTDIICYMLPNGAIKFAVSYAVCNANHNESEYFNCSCSVPLRRDLEAEQKNKKHFE